VLEGVRLVEDALLAGVRPDFALYRADVQAEHTAAAKLLDRLAAGGVACLAVEPRLFNRLSDVQTPQGVLAVCPWPELSPREPLSLVLVLDGVADPGNLGSALRTAAAVGVDLALLPPDTVDPYNPKVMRGGMGAHFRAPIRQQGWDQIGVLDLPLVLADAAGRRTIYEMDWTQPVTLVVGGEAHGPGEHARALASEVVRIPMASGESLNTAVAASVILYEIYRQRCKSAE
jgi:TrmH family RNA methyltransferase